MQKGKSTHKAGKLLCIPLIVSGLLAISSFHSARHSNLILDPVSSGDEAMVYAALAQLHESNSEDHKVAKITKCHVTFTGQFQVFKVKLDRVGC